MLGHGRHRMFAGSSLFRTGDLFSTPMYVQSTKVLLALVPLNQNDILIAGVAFMQPAEAYMYGQQSA
jgi:hypothetical protein